MVIKTRKEQIKAAKKTYREANGRYEWNYRKGGDLFSKLDAIAEKFYLPTPKEGINYCIEQVYSTMNRVVVDETPLLNEKVQQQQIEIDKLKEQVTQLSQQIENVENYKKQNMQLLGQVRYLIKQEERAVRSLNEYRRKVIPADQFEEIKPSSRFLPKES